MKISAYLLCAALAVLPAAVPVARAEDGSSSIIPAKAYTHPQTLVGLRSGRRMNLFCTGRGMPVVVFQAGLGASAFTWRHVQGPVSASMRACSYDRAGYGFSDPSDCASDARDTVDDLHNLLAAAGVAMPVVLVGHSIGGLYDTLYVETYPHDVAGMVLVDPSVAHQDDAFTSRMTLKQKAALQVSKNKLLADVGHWLALARSGVLSRSEQQGSPCLDNPPDADPVLHRELNREWARPATYATNLSEWRSTFASPDGLSPSDAELPQTEPRFGALPLVVLTPSDVRAFPGQTLQQARDVHAVWQTRHDALAAASTRGMSVQVSHSGHFIQDDQPQAVIKAVRDVVDMARRG